MKDATDMHAVFANIDILDDSVITAVNKDAELMQKMILTLSCSNLPCMDTRSNTDAICVLWLMKDKQKTEKQMISKTEIIYDSANPDFV